MAATFVPDAEGVYVLSLVVNDGEFNSTADTVPVTVLDASAAFTSADAFPILMPVPVTEINSTITVVGGPASISYVRVYLNMAHMWDADLDIFLISPSGKQVALSLQRGLNGENYTATLFDDSAAVAIANGAAPFTGSFRPEAPLSAMAGENTNGTWELFVVDLGVADTGTIDSWDLQLWY